jgi:hypothetical protein
MQLLSFVGKRLINLGGPGSGPRPGGGVSDEELKKHPQYTPSDHAKATHELTREQYFNDPDRVKKDVALKTRTVKYNCVTPGPGGPFRGAMEHPSASKGDVISAMMGKAKVTSVHTKEGGEKLDNMQLFQRGKEFHKNAVKAALSQGKHVPPGSVE